MHKVPSQDQGAQQHHDGARWMEKANRLINLEWSAPPFTHA